METLKKSEQFDSLNEFMAQIPFKTKRRVEVRVRIANRIEDTLVKRGISKSKFAKMVERSPSEITRWLSGDHNFTIDTLSDIEDALKVRLLCIRDEHSIVVVGAVQMMNVSSRQINMTDNVLDRWNHIFELNHPLHDFRRNVYSMPDGNCLEFSLRV